ncbi:MAG: hypothetical protein ACOYIT_04475 [Christensenellales bacterium]|jgi:hypothetical protein
MKLKRKCYSFRCDRYPKCGRAAGSCCGIEEDMYEDGSVIKDEECFDKENYPLFLPKEK